MRSRAGAASAGRWSTGAASTRTRRSANSWRAWRSVRSPRGRIVPGRPEHTDDYEKVVHGLALFEGSCRSCTARSEAMDEDWYVAERMIRSRVAEAQARARFAALLGQSNEHSRSKSFGMQFVDLGRSLVNKLRWSSGKHTPDASGASQERRHSHAPWT